MHLFDSIMWFILSKFFDSIKPRITWEHFVFNTVILHAKYLSLAFGSIQIMHFDKSSYINALGSKLGYFAVMSKVNLGPTVEQTG